VRRAGAGVTEVNRIMPDDAEELRTYLWNAVADLRRARVAGRDAEASALDATVKAMLQHLTKLYAKLYPDKEREPNDVR
jgi:hypothetical protein